MKLAILIIGQNQSEYIPQMLSRLSQLSADRYWVLDRCTDRSEELLRRLKETNVIVNQEGSGFLAGKMRDKGLDVILEKDYDAVLFLDGDRIPLEDVSQKSLEKAFSLADVSLCPMEADTRIVRNFKPLKDFKPNHFISCGFLAATSVLKTIRELSFMKNRCFLEDFDGEYGYEDCFFGKIINDIGYRLIWNNITVSGAIIFDDIQKMRALKKQEDKYCVLICKYSVGTVE